MAAWVQLFSLSLYADFTAYYLLKKDFPSLLSLWEMPTFVDAYPSTTIT